MLVNDKANNCCHRVANS